MLTVTASVVMLATLPGRTQGLGLITEPLIEDLRLDRLQFANINLWATLIGASFCFPAGWLFDRLGLRWTTAGIIVLLAAAVSLFSVLTGSIVFLMLLLTATRGLGQSALSVASITAVGKRFGDRVGMPMAVFSILLSVLFAGAFGFIGYSVRTYGWRTAWLQVAGALLLIVPFVLFFFRSQPRSSPGAKPIENAPGYSLRETLRTPAFWVFGSAVALFNLVSSGLGLFNEAVLAERGFDRKTFHIFLAVTTLLSLGGQFLCGWLSRRFSYRTLTGMAMAIYAGGLGLLPFMQTRGHLFAASVLIGCAGGMIIVVFFAVWPETFGRQHLGRIQGAAQFLTVVSSAIGPVLFAKAFAHSGSYTPLLLSIAGVVLVVGWTATRTPLPPLAVPEPTAAA